MRIWGILLLALTLLLLSLVNILAQSKDEITSENFLQSRESVQVIAFIQETLKEGNAIKLQPPVQQLLVKIQSETEISNLDAVQQNMRSLISITEGMISEQKYSDHFEAEMLLPKQTMLRNLQRASDEDDVEQIDEYSYAPPEFDRVYNEEKKKLLDLSYKFLEEYEKQYPDLQIQASEMPAPSEGAVRPSELKAQSAP